MSAGQKDLPTPEALQGLGLSQDQLRQVHAYFGQRAAVGRSQQRTLIGVLILFASGFMVGYLQADTKDLPFESLVTVLLRWGVTAGTVVSAVALTLQWYRIDLLNKAVGTIGLTERARAKVLSLGRMVGLVSVFGRLLHLVWRDEDHAGPQ